MLQSDLIYLKLLILANKLYSTHYGFFRGPLELEVITVPQQALKLFVHSVIAYAYDGCLRVLNRLDQCLDATAVTCTDPIDLVHDDHALLGFMCLLNIIMHGFVSIILFLPLQPSHGEVVQ